MHSNLIGDQVHQDTPLSLKKVDSNSTYTTTVDCTRISVANGKTHET